MIHHTNIILFSQPWYPLRPSTNRDRKGNDKKLNDRRELSKNINDEKQGYKIYQQIIETTQSVFVSDCLLPLQDNRQWDDTRTK